MKTKRARSAKTVSGEVRSRPSPLPNRAKADPLQIPPLLLEGDDPGPRAPAGPGEKFALGTPAPPGPIQPQAAVLPESYGTGKLLLLARDPHWLYAQWDLTLEQQRRYNSLSAEGHLAVRVQRSDVPLQSVAEVPVHPESRHWFIELSSGPEAQRAGGGYAAELGYYASGGNWVAVARSQPVPLPSDKVAADKAVRFATVAAEAAQNAARPGQPPGPTGITPPRVAWLAGRPTGPGADIFVRSIGSAPAGVQKPGEPLATEPGAAAAGTDAPPAGWTAQQERALAAMMSAANLPHGQVSSLELAELAPGPGEAVSSFPVGGPPGPGGFWFNVNADLVIHGATQPDARVTLAGQPIQLRPDGTFSCRFSLPDGVYEVEVAATSADNETRRAVLKFSRRTETPGEVGAQPQDP